MSNDEHFEQCSCCLSECIEYFFKLPCGHYAHNDCARTQYKSQKNVYVDYTPLIPSCPICRAQIHSRDLPEKTPAEKKWLEDREKRERDEEARLLNQRPSYASMRPGERPLRSNKAKRLMERSERQHALDRLIKLRNRIIAKRAGSGSPQPGPSRPNTSRARNTGENDSSDSDTPRPTGWMKHYPVLDSSSSSVSTPKKKTGFLSRLSAFLSPKSGSSSQKLSSMSSPSSDRLHIDTSYRRSASSERSAQLLPVFHSTSQPTTVATHERTPQSVAFTSASQPVNSLISKHTGVPVFQIGSHEGDSASQCSNISHRARGLKYSPTRDNDDVELQDIQRAITVVSKQLEYTQVPNPVQPESIEIESDDSDLDDDEISGPALQPIGITGFYGLGRNIKYFLRWNNQTTTLQGADETDRIALEILSCYRRQIRNESLRLHRERKKQGLRLKRPKKH